MIVPTRTTPPITPRVIPKEERLEPELESSLLELEAMPVPTAAGSAALALACVLVIDDGKGIGVVVVDDEDDDHEDEDEDDELDPVDGLLVEAGGYIVVVEVESLEYEVEELV